MRTEVKKSVIQKRRAMLNGKVTQPSLLEAPAVGKRHHTTSSERSEQAALLFT